MQPAIAQKIVVEQGIEILFVCLFFCGRYKPRLKAYFKLWFASAPLRSLVPETDMSAAECGKSEMQLR